jgi:hypothetical protein
MDETDNRVTPQWGVVAQELHATSSFRNGGLAAGGNTVVGPGRIRGLQ